MLGATKPEDPVLDPDQFCTGPYIAPVAPTPRQQSPRGFGDLIASALSAVGVTQERVSSWIGGECGCAARQEKLNRLGAWAASFLSGAPTEQIENMIKNPKS
jgi:hypothetical protein